MAVFLYKERLYGDAAYYTFNLINDGWFYLDGGGLVLALGQISPLLGYCLGLPIKLILILASLGHLAVLYLVFIILFYGLKDSVAVFLLLFVHLFGLLWQYYVPMNEITNGAIFVVLFYAILRTQKVEDDKWLILMLLAQWLALTAHPVNFLILIFVLFLDYLKNSWRKRIHSISIVVIIIAGLLKLLTLTDTGKSDVAYDLIVDSYEIVYISLVYLLGFAIAYLVYNKLGNKFKSVLAVVFILALLLRIYWIWDFGEPLRQRIVQMERTIGYLQTFEQSKFLINDENYEKDYSFYSWANPIEVLLFSAIAGKEKTISLIRSSEMDAVIKRSAKLNKTDFVFRKTEVKPSNFLNSRYFYLPNGGYNDMNKAVYIKPASTIKDAIYLKPFSKHGLEFKASDTAYLSIVVQNNSENPLPSKISEQTFLSYHWYKNNESVDWDGIRTPLELDILHTYVQDIQLAIPKEAGSYELQLDVVKEGEMWFEISEKFSVKVK